ncbi:nodulation-signaling pathway 2 protein-like [Forsythia ovata]|uniref:Nodulation-signaling pathway 2 protein-like n=1 Tax=Forsythia ovata TaxID=205694 RepID=A0ABD1SIF1_9LAMI
MDGDEWSPCLSVESSENSVVFPPERIESPSPNGEEKSNPLGKTMEHMAFYLFQLKVKSRRLPETIISQYGRFAHFTANSEILEAMPDDAATMHIVGFDIGEEIQWPSVIETIGRMHKAPLFTLKIR